MLLRCLEYSDTALEFTPSPVGVARSAGRECNRLVSLIVQCSIETTFSLLIEYFMVVTPRKAGKNR